MQISSRFQLNLVEESDPVNIGVLTNNFSTLDQNIARRIQERSFQVTMDQWNVETKQAVLPVEGIQRETRGLLVMDIEQTNEEERKMITYAKIFVAQQGEESLTLQCDGNVPTSTIHLKIIDYGVD